MSCSTRVCAADMNCATFTICETVKVRRRGQCQRRVGEEVSGGTLPLACRTQRTCFTTQATKATTKATANKESAEDAGQQASGLRFGE